MQSLSRPRWCRSSTRALTTSVEDGKVLGLAHENRVVGPALGVLAAVPVPFAVVQGDDPSAGLDQPAGHQQALRNARSAIAVHEDLRVAGAVALGDGERFPGQVEGLGQPGRGQQAEGLLGEGVHSLERARRIDFAAQVVEALQQGLAVGQPLHRNAAQHHVVPGRSHRAEGGQCGAQEAGAGLVVGSVRAGVTEADERRHGRIDRSLNAGDGGAELRPAAGWRWFGRVVAVVDLDGVVAALVADQGAHEHQFVHDPGQARQGLADLDSRDIGRGRLPRAGDFLGGVRLEVEHVLMRRAADQVDQDHRFLGRADARVGLGSKQLRQGQPAQAKGADLEETPAGQLVRSASPGSGWLSLSRHQHSPGRTGRQEHTVGSGAIFQIERTPPGNEGQDNCCRARRIGCGKSFGSGLSPPPGWPGRSARLQTSNGRAALAPSGLQTRRSR